MEEPVNENWIPIIEQKLILGTPTIVMFTHVLICLWTNNPVSYGNRVVYFYPVFAKQYRPSVCAFQGGGQTNPGLFSSLS